MNLDLAASLISTVIVFSSLLYQVSLWQRKEYRLDRLRSFIFSQENSICQDHPLLIGWLLVGLSWLSYFILDEKPAELLAWLAIIAFAIHHGLRLRRFGLYRPKWTIKSITASAIALLLYILYAQYTIVTGILPATQAATMLFFVPAVCALAVALTNIPFGIRKFMVARQAGQKRAQLTKLQVVGITGSYGKTSTKYFLSQILTLLNQPHIATPKHCNSYYAVANHFLHSVKPDTTLYIAEMGAYRSGEIKQLAGIVQPTIATLTAVSNQHVSLFGSPEKLLDAKWEIVEALPPDGTAVLSDDDTRLKQKAAGLTKKTIRFSTAHQADVWLEHMTVHDQYVAGTIHIGSHSQAVQLPVISAGLAQSAVAAAATAYALDQDAAAIAGSLQKLTAMPRTMAGHTNPQGAFIIDDSYSGGEHAALNAIRHLSYFTKSDKRIAFVPIIELGEEAARAHEAIGKAMGEANASVYIYGTAYQVDIAKGLGSKAKDANWITDPAAFAETVSQNLTPNSVLLLEGRVPSLVHKTLGI